MNSAERHGRESAGVQHVLADRQGGEWDRQRVRQRQTEGYRIVSFRIVRIIFTIELMNYSHCIESGGENILPT